MVLWIHGMRIWTQPFYSKQICIRTQDVKWNLGPNWGLYVPVPTRCRLVRYRYRYRTWYRTEHSGAYFLIFFFINVLLYSFWFIINHKIWAIFHSRKWGPEIKFCFIHDGSDLIRNRHTNEAYKKFWKLCPPSPDACFRTGHAPAPSWLIHF